MYSIPQVAKLVQKSRAQVWNWVQAGKLKAETTNGGLRREYRVTEKSLQDFLTGSHDIENLKNKPYKEGA